MVIHLLTNLYGRQSFNKNPQLIAIETLSSKVEYPEIKHSGKYLAMPHILHIVSNSPII